MDNQIKKNQELYVQYEELLNEKNGDELGDVASLNEEVSRLKDTIASLS